MTKPIFTCGYSGHFPPELLLAAQNLDALVIDIRMSPRSRMPQWDIANLQKVFGARYFHVQAFGNANYGTGDEIRIKDFEKGFKQVEWLAQTRPIILFCGCKHPIGCHRTTVAAMLRERGLFVEELAWPEIDPATSQTKIKTALSIKQPWAWLIVNGHKDVENRNWETRFRGSVLIHAGKSFDKEGYEFVKRHCPHIPLPEPEEFEKGGIVGSATMTDCVDEYDSDWFFGDYGFVLKDAKPLPFVECKGQLGFFKVEL